LRDRFVDECGVVGISGHPESANLTYLALQGLQHRGQESAGIVTQNDQFMYVHREMGLVADIFTERVLRRLPGSAAIGHVRYSTSGSSNLKNAQPFTVDYAHGSLAIAHNGNLVNAHGLRTRLENDGAIFQSTMDTEVVVHLLARSKTDQLEDRLVEALSQVTGAYCLVVLGEGRLIAVRDPHGYRPLVLGEKDGAPVVASESCALDLIEATFVREVEPGEMLVIRDRDIKSYYPFERHKIQQCVFEFIYFARPDSRIFGDSVNRVREKLGEQLAREHPVDADVVMGVPDSGIQAAIGYSRESGIPYSMGMIRSHYVGRTFIEPAQSIRHFGVRLKLAPVRSVLRGKRVVVIDDSIVRGTTSKKICAMIKAAGASEVHMRISSPPTAWPCYYGIDTPTRDELIASSNSVEQIREAIEVDSLGYLSVPGVQNCLSSDPETFCYACFDGKYHVPYQPPDKLRQLTLFANGEKRRTIIEDEPA
jgi:amidophosphoribosyltransferase